MAFVNNEDISAAAGWQSGKSPLRFCQSGETYTCKPSLQVCCLMGVRESGIRVPFTPYVTDLSAIGGPSAGWRWDIGDACEYDRWGVNNLSTNSCIMRSRWGCTSRYELTWAVQTSPDPDFAYDGSLLCKNVIFRLQYIAGSSVGSDPPFVTRARVDRLWHTTGITMDDPWYLWMNYKDPEGFPLPCKTITIGNCPVPTVFDDCVDPDGPEGPEEPPEDPEPCDPGCWPPCVMCPARKTLYAVISGAPVCCVAGAYELEWVGTGGSGFPTVGYYELPAPVGGPIDTCGVIDFLRVYCLSASQIQVQLVYRRAEGTEISNLSSPLTLDVSCSDGDLESEPFHIPGRSSDRESLCGFGDGVGGDLRIVSA